MSAARRSVAIPSLLSASEVLADESSAALVYEEPSEQADSVTELPDGNTDTTPEGISSEDSSDLSEISETETDNLQDETTEADIPDPEESATESDHAGVGSVNPTTKSNEKTKAEEKTKEKFTGWKNEKGSWLYYKNGVPYKGWNYMDSDEGEDIPHWSYFDSDGKLYTGWHNMGKKEGEKTAHWSYFGYNGWLRTGWVRLGKADGEKTEHWSYFGDNGWLRTGWVSLGKADGEKIPHWSYFGNNGWLRTGWVELGRGASEPDSNSERHWSYFGGNGWLRTGWVELGRGTSEPDGNSERHWSYFGGNGWLQTGWKHFTGKDGEESPHWSYFGGNGWLRTGWYTNNEGLHWFNSKGWLAVGNPVVEGKLYNDTNNNGVLKANTTFTGWHYYNGKWYHILKGTLNPRMKVGTYIINGQWYEIENAVSTGLSKGKAILAHASGDENGRFVNGTAGDQTINEVYTRSWYPGPKDDYGNITPWEYVIRAKDTSVRKKIAYAMERAVNNDKIGYDMYNRKTLYNYASKVGWDPGKVTSPCECDCSSLVAVACRYAGISANYVEVGSNVFVTANMRLKLLASEQFTAFSSKDYTAAHDKLVVGDILVKENGHTAVVIRSDADMK